MEAFNGVWKIVPSSVKGHEELFKLIAPPDMTMEDMNKPHETEISVAGQLVTVRNRIEGRPEVITKHTVGGTDEVEYMGLKAKVTNKFENGHLNSEVVGPKGSFTMDRYIQDGCMFMTLSAGGKNWTAKMTH